MRQGREKSSEVLSRKKSLMPVGRSSGWEAYRGPLRASILLPRSRRSVHFRRPPPSITHLQAAVLHLGAEARRVSLSPGRLTRGQNPNLIHFTARTVTLVVDNDAVTGDRDPIPPHGSGGSTRPKFTNRSYAIDWFLVPLLRRTTLTA